MGVPQKVPPRKCPKNAGGAGWKKIIIARDSVSKGGRITYRFATDHYRYRKLIRFRIMIKNDTNSNSDHFLIRVRILTILRYESGSWPLLDTNSYRDHLLVWVRIVIILWYGFALWSFLDTDSDRYWLVIMIMIMISPGGFSGNSHQTLRRQARTPILPRNPLNGQQENGESLVNLPEKTLRQRFVKFSENYLISQGFPY